MPRCSAILGLVLLFGALVVSEGLTADSDGPKDGAQKTATPSGPSSDQATLTELHNKRDKAQAELDAVNQPKTLAAGAPAGTSQEELLERRTLLHHIVRNLDEQIDDTLRLEQARRQRNQAPESSSAAPAPEESPPYSVFFADQLWDTIYSLHLAVEGLQSQQSLIELRSGRARDALQATEERLRQVSERLESAKGTVDDRQRWLRDLETLRQKAAAVLLQATELSKTRIGEELSDAKARLESAEHLLAV